jgi:hypothetical protein
LAQLEGSVMTFSLPSFSAAATRALMPPHEAAEVAVAQLQLAAALAVDEEPPPAAAALVVELAALDELELLQPAASKIDPTAATDATIALDARK